MKRQGEEGIVLIITLWVIVVLSTVTMSYVRLVDLEMKMVKFQRDNTICDAAAKAGLRQAMILLREDKYKDMGDELQSTVINFSDYDDYYEYDAKTEEWYDSPAMYIDVPFFEKNPDENEVAYYYVDVEDESAKFPLNNQKTSLKMIAHLRESTGVEEDEAQFLAGVVIDWRDKNENPTISETGSSFQRDGSNEYAYYNEQYNPEDLRIPRFTVKNKEFDSIDELLMLPGFTPQIVYGTVDPAERSGGGRFGRRHFRRGEYLGLKHFCTVYTNHVNLNTVKAEVLEALMFDTIGEDAESIAREWVEYREKDNPLKTLDNSDMDDSHFTDVTGFTPAVMKGIRQFVSVSSNIFVVTSLAEYKGIQKGFKAVCARRYLTFEELPQFGMDTFNVEDLQQVPVWIRKIEPLYDVKERLERAI